MTSSAPPPGFDGLRVDGDVARHLLLERPSLVVGDAGPQLLDREESPGLHRPGVEHLREVDRAVPGVEPRLDPAIEPPRGVEQDRRPGGALPRGHAIELVAIAPALEPEPP